MVFKWTVMLCLADGLFGTEQNERIIQHPQETGRAFCQHVVVHTVSVFFFLSILSPISLSLSCWPHFSQTHACRSVQISLDLYLSVSATGDDLVFLRVVTHNTEQGVGQDHLIPHKPPGWEMRTRQTDVIESSIKNVFPPTKRNSSVSFHVLRARAYPCQTYTKSQMMQAPSELAVTHSLSLLLILMQFTVALCSFIVSMSRYESWNISQTLTFIKERCQGYIFILHLRMF